MKNVATAEEVIYPPFILSPPIFAASRPLDAQKWWNSTIWMLAEFAYRRGDWLHYTEKHGQIFVFENVTISKSTPFDEWNMQACTSNLVPTSYVEPSSAVPSHDSVLLANVPDSWSFQHFLDHTMRVVAQSHAYETSHVATGREGSQVVNDFWASLGYAPDQVLHQDTTFVASHLIWSCRAPLVHPWLQVKSLSMLCPHNTPTVPISDRKVILYMTRSNDLIKNPGRQIINENLLLTAIQDLLNTRAENETLRVFNHNEFTDTSTLMLYLQQNVKAIIGPHGSAFHNHLWTESDTLVVELQPITRPDLSFFQSAKLKGQPYAVIMLDAVSEVHDMVADVSAVVEILGEKMGKVSDESEGPKLFYDWGAVELGVY